MSDLQKHQAMDYLLISMIQDLLVLKLTVNWQKKFNGKKIFKDGSTDIALGVKKEVKNPENEVDAVTGATLTSNGVNDMLKTCLAKYKLVKK